MTKFQAWFSLSFAIGLASLDARAIATGRFWNTKTFGAVTFDQRPLAFVLYAALYGISAFVLGAVALKNLTKPKKG